MEGKIGRRCLQAAILFIVICNVFSRPTYKTGPRGKCAGTQVLGSGCSKLNFKRNKRKNKPFFAEKKRE